MPDAVAVRIRPRPYLLIGERFNQSAYLMRCFPVKAFKVADKSGVEVAHGGDSNKSLTRAV